jgi:hypothetical protein
MLSSKAGANGLFYLNRRLAFYAKLARQLA